MSGRRQKTKRNYPKRANPVLGEVLRALWTTTLTERELADTIGRTRSAPYVQELRDRGFEIATEAHDGVEHYRLLAIRGVPVQDVPLAAESDVFLRLVQGE